MGPATGLIEGSGDAPDQLEGGETPKELLAGGPVVSFVPTEGGKAPVDLRFF